MKRVPHPKGSEIPKLPRLRGTHFTPKKFPQAQVAFGVRVEMATDQAAAEYRLHAAHCMDIARQSSDPERALAFLGMAKVWLTLADIVEKHSALSDVAPLEN